jgi:hypothetical protein
VYWRVSISCITCVSLSLMYHSPLYINLSVVRERSTPVTARGGYFVVEGVFVVGFWILLIEIVFLIEYIF